MGRIPALNTFWRLLQHLERGALLRAVNAWWGTVAGVEGIRVDEKVLRGSKREGEAAWMVWTALGQRIGMVLEQLEVEEGDQTAGALALLQRIPLEGKRVTVDAGFLQRPVVQAMVEKGGPIEGH